MTVPPQTDETRRFSWFSRSLTALCGGRPLTVAVLALALTSAVLLLAALNGVPPNDLLRDPAASMEYPPYLGLFSHLGIALLWITAAGTWTGLAAGGPERRSLIAAGAFSALLALDDQFLLHEEYIPLLIPNGERVMFLFYAICGLTIAVLNWRRILRPEHLALLLSLICLGLSVIVDISGGLPRIMDVAEDVFKFVGLFLWAYYWCGLARREILRSRAA